MTFALVLVLVAQDWPASSPAAASPEPHNRDNPVINVSRHLLTFKFIYSYKRAAQIFNCYHSSMALKTHAAVLCPRPNCFLILQYTIVD